MCELTATKLRLGKLFALRAECHFHSLCRLAEPRRHKSEPFTAQLIEVVLICASQRRSINDKTRRDPTVRHNQGEASWHDRISLCVGESLAPDHRPEHVVFPVLVALLRGHDLASCTWASFPMSEAVPESNGVRR
jgi:hypothetical protein